MAQADPHYFPRFIKDKPVNHTVRITTPDTTSPVGVKVHYVRDGADDVEMKNVYAINIEISPDNAMIATVSMLIADSTIFAEAILSEESLREAAEYYGLELVDKARASLSTGRTVYQHSRNI